MALVINTNIASLNAQRNLSRAQAPLQTAMQRLSSTLRINSAKDDAAGLAVATRMLSQARGLSQAVRNANDGISVAQTAEGALDEVGTSLQRIRELAVQSAHGIYSSSERNAMNQEAQQLVSEINRIAGQTRFSTVNLLDGSFGTKGLQVGSEANEVINISMTSVKTETILGASYTTIGADVTANALGAGDLAFVVGGQTYNVGAAAAGTTTQGQYAESAWAKAGAINLLTSLTGITATAADTVRTGTAVAAAAATTRTLTAIAAGGQTSTVFDITGRLGTYTITANFAIDATAATVRDAIVAAVNAAPAQAATGITAAADAGDTYILTESGGGDITTRGVTNPTRAGLNTDIVVTDGAADIDVSFTINGQTVAYSLSQTQGSAAARTTALRNAVNAANAGVVATITGSNEIKLTGAGGVDIRVAALDAGPPSELTVTGLTVADTRSSITLNSSSNYTIAGSTPADAGFTAVAASGGLGAVNISTVAGANLAINSSDTAIATVTSSRSDIGAILNRLESTVRNLENVVENITAARSRIMDADFAAETANLTKSMIMQQAGISVLSQANTLPQNVLALLGGR